MELFSDGVFVIVLTLLVLDLKPPEADGWAGLAAIAPGLLVHALTFLIIGGLWLGHHNMLSRVYEITFRTLVLNLFALFWITLIPFGARIAAEHPLGQLGIGLITACRGFYGLSSTAMAASTASRNFDDPRFRRRITWRRRYGFAISVALLAAGGLCAVSPWFGYAMVPTIFLSIALQRPLREAPGSDAAANDSAVA